MHFFGFTGLLTFLVGIVCAAWIIVEKLVAQAQHLPYRAVTEQPGFFLALAALVIGILLFLAGLIGEMVSRNSSERNHYNIKEEL
jgi:uncharacterized membrane protein YqaE (UPF0057 family)